MENLIEARQIDRITNNNQPENRDAIDILESELLRGGVLVRLSRKKKKNTDGEEEDGSATEVVSMRINCIEFMKRRQGERSMMMDKWKSRVEQGERGESVRLRTHSTDDGEEEDGSATEAVSDANKLHRVHEEQRRKEHDDGREWKSSIRTRKKRTLLSYQGRRRRRSCYYLTLLPLIAPSSRNERKRLRSHSTDDGEEEDGSATEAVSDVNKFHRVHEARTRRKEHDDGPGMEIRVSEQGEEVRIGNQNLNLMMIMIKRIGNQKQQ
ncbi:hypothetical protein HAX54_046206 [Datura stramonium]|uniref:Uncharacterized protein n=1 Tax=Datura stramonium TaxID=4076 RepID=A0ABS8SRJ8_DATST|nr:hypothetical protein [Datura stramonium]